MERAEAEGKIIARLMDAVAVLKEYDPRSTCLSLTYNGDEQFINGYNEAFRKECKEINFMSDAPKAAKAPKIESKSIGAIDVKVDTPDLFTLDEIEKATSHATADIMQSVGKKPNIKQYKTMFEAVLRLYGVAIIAYLAKTRQEGEK